MAKRKFALTDRDQECTDHHWSYTGTIPNTGPQKCTLCGTQREGRYEIKCNECKAAVGRTDSVQRSAEGGMCDECKLVFSTHLRAAVDSLDPVLRDILAGR